MKGGGWKWIGLTWLAIFAFVFSRSDDGGWLLFVIFWLGMGMGGAFLVSINKEDYMFKNFVEFIVGILMVMLFLWLVSILV